MPNDETKLDERGLLRPIIGIEYRTAQEAFDIMADRIRAHLSHSGEGEIPTGAIENGREFLRRLVDHYDFYDEKHPLRNCVEYTEAVRCFEHLASFASALTPDTRLERAVAALEIIAERDGILGTWDEKFRIAQEISRSALTSIRSAS